MDRSALYKTVGIFFVIVGSMVMGIAAGMGFVAFMVKQRLPCLAVDGASTACQDILDPAMNMILVSGVGGFVAFATGLIAVGLVMREEQTVGGEND